LYRVLLALDSVGVFAEDDRGRVPGSRRYLAIEELGENHYPAWERVLHSVEMGATAFDHVYGVSKWQYMAEHSDEARIFDAAMSSFSSVVAAAAVAAYDFSSSATNPALRGVVADLPHVVAGAQRRLEADGLADRCEVAAGSFFESAPAGDVYPAGQRHILGASTWI
jgi:hypothetical protein